MFDPARSAPCTVHDLHLLRPEAVLTVRRYAKPRDPTAAAAVASHILHPLSSRTPRVAENPEPSPTEVVLNLVELWRRRR
jgi:hypothetical protein